MSKVLSTGSVDWLTHKQLRENYLQAGYPTENTGVLVPGKGLVPLAGSYLFHKEGDKFEIMTRDGFASFPRSYLGANRERPVFYVDHSLPIA